MARNSIGPLHKEGAPIRPHSVWAGEPGQSLPRPLTSFVGRETDLEAIERLLTRDGIRLLTLAGPGGIGKTRLAIKLGTALAGGFDAVYFVPMASITDAMLVPQTIAAAVGATPNARARVEHALVAHLYGLRALLVLDNFEQLLTAAPLVTELLEACPDLVVIVTSRTRLNVTGERVYPAAASGWRGTLTGGYPPAGSTALRIVIAVPFKVRRNGNLPGRRIQMGTVLAPVDVYRAWDGPIARARTAMPHQIDTDMRECLARVDELTQRRAEP